MSTYNNTPYDDAHQAGFIQGYNEGKQHRYALRHLIVVSLATASACLLLFLLIGATRCLR